jgi:hypothetical protein
LGTTNPDDRQRLWRRAADICAYLPNDQGTAVHDQIRADLADVGLKSTGAH